MGFNPNKSMAPEYNSGASRYSVYEFVLRMPSWRSALPEFHASSYVVIQEQTEQSAVQDSRSSRALLLVGLQPTPR